MLDWTGKSDSFTTFRGKGIGSSDMPIIMGVSPWNTPYKLWLDKTGIKPSEFKGNAATKRGNDLEPMVRKWYNDQRGCVMVPERFVHATTPHFRCNVDGVDSTINKLIEIKCGNIEDHIKCVQEGIIPDKYYPQCQWLMYVSGIHALDYVSYNDKLEGDEYCIVTVEYNEEYVADMVKKADEFWECVQSKTPPLMSENDKVIIDDKEMVDLVAQYAELELQKKQIDADLKKLQAEISSRCQHKKAECLGWSLNWVTRKGSVDYGKINELKGVNLDDYRKPESSYFTIKRLKND